MGGNTAGQRSEDADLVARLVKSYNKRKSEIPSDQWNEIFQQHHADIVEAIERGDAKQITSFLRDPVSCDMFYGFDSLSKSLRQGGQRIEDKYAPMGSLDTLVCLAEAIGARRLDYPENYTWKIAKFDVEDIIRELDQAFRFKFDVPNIYPQEYGLLTSRGVISYRVPQAMYQAWKIRQLTKGMSNPRVVEIGGGLGRTAYYAHQFDVKDYTIVDIPISSLAQGYFLGRTLGDEGIALHGDGDFANRNDAVKIISPEDFLKGTGDYDLVVNVDSLTEIGWDAAKAYWDKIETCTGMMLSINHEQNDTKIIDLLKGSMHVTSSTRSPYWLRRGYVEEIITLSTTSNRAD